MVRRLHDQSHPISFEPTLLCVFAPRKAVDHLGLRPYSSVTDANRFIAPPKGGFHAAQLLVELSRPSPSLSNYCHLPTKARAP